jgi:hypothetical protein
MSTRSRKIMFLGSRARPVHRAGWQPYRHLWADCLDNVGSSTSPWPIMGIALFFFTFFPVFVCTGALIMCLLACNCYKRDLPHPWPLYKLLIWEHSRPSLPPVWLSHVMSYPLSTVLIVHKVKNKAIPVTGRRGLQGCEMLRIPCC